MKENKYLTDQENEEMKSYESLEEDLEFEYEKVLNQLMLKEKKELKDELVKAYEMEMIEVEDINVIKETSEEDFEYYQALEKGINTGKE